MHAVPHKSKPIIYSNTFNFISHLFFFMLLLLFFLAFGRRFNFIKCRWQICGSVPKWQRQSTDGLSIHHCHVTRHFSIESKSQSPSHPSPSSLEWITCLECLYYWFRRWLQNEKIYKLSNEHCIFMYSSCGSFGF